MITIAKFLYLHRCEYIMENGRQCRKPARVILTNYKRYCRQHLKRMTLAGELPPGVSQLKGKKGVIHPDKGVNNVQYANVADSKSNVEVKKVEDIELARLLQHYENKIGNITPKIAEVLKDALSHYPADKIIEAIDTACKANKRSLAYVDFILLRLHNNGEN